MHNEWSDEISNQIYESLITRLSLLLLDVRETFRNKEKHEDASH